MYIEALDSGHCIGLETILKTENLLASFWLVTLDNFLQNSVNIFFKFCVRYLSGQINLVLVIFQKLRCFDGLSDPVISPGLSRQDLASRQPQKEELRQSKTKTKIIT